VVDSTFSPYYDRTAVSVLYRIRIETVSEYQTELLRAIAIDVRSEDRLAALEETFLDITVPEDPAHETEPLELGRDQSKQIIDQTRGELLDVVEPTIDEIHQEASRAADAELEEYHQMQEQRIEELQEQRSDLTSKIDELSNSIPQAAGQRDRVDDLKTRKDLKSDLNEIDTELEDLRRCREQGFPSMQQEIRDRHALEVVVTPLTITEVQYERGEAHFKLMDDSASVDITLGYGNGVGVTEDIHCDRCGEELTGGNPVSSMKDGIQCENCSRSS
jgi:chromosome segregation ATPase